MRSRSSTTRLTRPTPVAPRRAAVAAVLAPGLKMSGVANVVLLEREGVGVLTADRFGEGLSDVTSPVGTTTVCQDPAQP